LLVGGYKISRPGGQSQEKTVQKPSNFSCEEAPSGPGQFT
jgi:hypothetical protein